MTLSVAGEDAQIEESVQLRLIGNLFGIAEFADISSVSVVNDHEVRLAECRDGDFAFRQRGDGNGSGHRNGPNEAAVPVKNEHEIGATVGYINAAFGIDIAVFAKDNVGRARFCARIGRQACTNLQHWLAALGEDNDSRRWSL